MSRNFAGVGYLLDEPSGTEGFVVTLDEPSGTE